MFIELKNLKIHYKVSGNGAPVVLLHGWGRSIDYLSNLQAHLAQKFRVYALDLPGFGLSTVPLEVWGSADYANLVKLFIQELTITDPIVIGHSLGGKIAVYLAIDGAIGVRQLVLFGSAGVRLPKSFKTKSRIYFAKLLKFIVKLPIIKSLLATRMELYRQKFGSQDYQNARGIMRAILVRTVNENIIELLTRIKVPTLLVWGEQDHETPLQAGEIMLQRMVNSRLKIVPGSGHFPFLDNWEVVKKELDVFLCQV